MSEVLVQKLQRMFSEAAAEFSQLRLAYLFGSRAGHRPVGPISDLDVAVWTDGPSAGADLQARLSSRLVRRTEAGRVDLVLLNDAPVELAYAIVATGRILYERDAGTRVDYESRVMGLYFDYLPVLRAQRRDILKGEDYAARVQRYRQAVGRTLRTLGQIGTVSG